MKPILIISDDRARILLASFFTYFGHSSMRKFIPELPADVIRGLLSIILDKVSKLDDHEKGECDE